ncbi:MAG: tetraacyldisaccharide 4'-kinase [Chitinophagia bacterium]|nr:tetraacyldisaccharide 4'-kinase [Chitinophagia bacterium]
MQQKSFLYYVTQLIRLLLYPLALLYGAIIWLRNRLYDVGFFTSIGFSLPVICVGNLSTGGTGKTPHVEYLLALLQYRYRVATMSRGYKRYTKGFLLAGPDANALKIGDEPMQYVLKFPEAVVSVAEERLTGIPSLLQRRPDVEVVVLDDAYQHRSVKAGLNILISDYAHPFYDDHILPFGNLREGRKAYERANMIIISKCPENLSDTAALAMERRIAPLPGQSVYFTRIAYGLPYHLFTRQAVDLTQQNIVLVCGIARPAPLVAYLHERAAAVHVLSYADHHYFVTSDIEEIRSAANNWMAERKLILTTEKDATRLLLHAAKLAEWDIDIAVLPIEVQFLLDRGELFNREIERYIEREIEENNPQEEHGTAVEHSDPNNDTPETAAENDTDDR